MTIDFAQRLAVGTKHEQQVTAVLERHGWTVTPCGQGTYPAPTIAALKRTDSALRWAPDLIASRGEHVVMIDAKTRVSEDTGRHAISRAAVRAHLQWTAWTDLPMYYVFDDFSTLTPHEVMTLGRTGPHLNVGRRGAYYLIGAGLCRPFEVVFAREDPMRQLALQLAASA